MPKSLFLVCDDAGPRCIDQGIGMLYDQTKQPLSAEYMITRPGAAERAKQQSRINSIAVGLHFELLGVTDSDRYHRAKELQAKGSSLGEQADVRGKAEQESLNQLQRFQDAVGSSPLHISTHGDYNLDKDGNIADWWNEHMLDIFDGDVPPMQHEIPVIRHNKYSWAGQNPVRPPLEPEEFAEVLQGVEGNAAELVLHPAYAYRPVPSLHMLFDSDMRKADLLAAIKIIESGVIEKEGFRIVHMNQAREVRAYAA